MPENQPVSLPDLAPAVVGFAGGRALQSEHGIVIAGIVRSLLRWKFRLAVGCAIGADEFAIATMEHFRKAQHCTIYASFGRDGTGKIATSSRIIGEAEAAGAEVHWLAGGPAHIPPRARLIRRTETMICSGIVALVSVWTRPDSKGTARACQIAAQQGIPVVAFEAFGDCPRPIGPGCWRSISASSRLWARGWRWMPEAGLPLEMENLR
jgi:hypothetical protein